MQNVEENKIEISRIIDHIWWDNTSDECDRYEVSYFQIARNKNLI